MNRRLLVVICVLIAILTVGCREEKKQLPPGVSVFGGKYYCYAVQMPAGKSVLDYFSLQGEEGMVAVSEGSLTETFDFKGSVYYREVAGGGWVGYFKSKTDKFVYLPAGFPKELVQSGCAELARTSGFLSIEDAAAYIPGLTA